MAYFCSTLTHFRQPPPVEPERFGMPGEVVAPTPLTPALAVVLAKISRRLKARGIEVDAAELLAEEE